jgi:putative ABC transport system permease protein
MDNLLQDIRYAARKLLRTPGFSVVVVATLAVAIGATTAVFSIVDGVLLKPLAFHEPDRLVEVTSIGRDGKPNAMSYLDYADYRARSRLVPEMSAIDETTQNITSNGTDPLRLRAARVNANFFDLVGVRPIAGRTFAKGEDLQSATPTVVLGEAFWRSRFGGDARIIGTTVELNAKPYTVIGVAPSSINYPHGVDAWLPMIPTTDELDPAERGAHFLDGIGRLAPRASVDQARSELAGIAKQLSKAYPESDTDFGAGAQSLTEAVVGDVRPALLIMLGCVGFVLLIACANVANLLLVRASTRETEMAVRTALGAGRSQLVRQLLTESLLLSGVGAIIGIALAAWVVDAVRAFGPRGVPRLYDVSINGTVLLFTAGIALVTGVLFGLIPAMQSAKTSLGQILKDSTRGSSGRRGTQRTRAVLVVTEMALAVILLIGAGLLTRSFVQLMNVNPGYQPEHVVTMSVSLPDKKYPWDHEQIAFANDVVEQMRRLPGAQDAALAFGRPLSQSGMRITFNRDDRPKTPPGKPLLADIRVVTPGFFSTLKIPLAAGRGFLETDRAGAPQVVVVSQRFAKHFFPNENPIGKRITLGWGRQRSADKADTVSAGGEIVGVATDIKARGARADAPETIYLPFEQATITDLSVLIRSTASPGLVISSARAALKGIDPDLPVFDEKTMTDVVSDSVGEPRFYAELLASFAAIALLLATLGIYGVISYAVSQRTRELGIRIALGASRSGIISLVVVQGMLLTATGVGVGLAASYWLTGLIAKLLFGVPSIDPLTFGGVAVVLLGVAAAATFIPARRAALVDPIIAMRTE